jgi:thioredoxin-like negative regulator of GroEL
VLQIHKDDVDAAEGLAQSLVELGRPEGAIQHLQSFLTQHPNTSRASELTAMMETLQAGNSTEAKELQ